MFNLASLIIGFVALICAVVAFMPLLGWANWLIIPLAVIGAGVGHGLARHRRPQPQPVRDRRRRRPADARRRDPVSRDPRIDAYIAKAAAVRPADPRAGPRAGPRGRSRRRGNDEVEHARPTRSDGKILLIMAAFKAHAALNFWRGQELRDDNAEGDAMGQFGKLTRVDDLPPDAELDALIREAADAAPSRAGAAQDQACAQAAARDASRIRRRAGQGAQGQGGARRLSAQRPARLSRMDRRSEAGRDPRRSASPTPSNG